MLSETYLLLVFLKALEMKKKKLEFDSEKCDFCGSCVAVCKPDAILLLENSMQIDQQKCNSCGWKNNDLTLRDREFVCLECSHVSDRDLNAAMNIRDVGLKILRDIQEYTPVETGGCRTLVQCQSRKQEKEVLGLDEHLCSSN